MSIEKEFTLADIFCGFYTRKKKKPFFIQINTPLDWEIMSFLTGFYSLKGKSAIGEPSHIGLVLFEKINLSILNPRIVLSNREK